MPKQRHLTDLYLVGKEHTIDDGRGDPVTVWIQKLNTTETELSRRRADAARSRVLSLRSQPDSDGYLSAVGDAFASVDKAFLVGLMLRPEEAKRRQVREAEVAFSDEWSEDNYLQGLRDAWINGLSDAFIIDNQDPEARRVFDELTRYEAQVEERLAGDLADERAELETLDVFELQRRVAEENLKAASDIAWFTDYRRSQVFHGVRKLENRARYFEQFSELGDLQNETFWDLYAALSALAVDPLEGKDSPEIPASSPLSEQPDEEETEVSSGLVAVGQ